jgi:hypothetical protein
MHPGLTWEKFHTALVKELAWRMAKSVAACPPAYVATPGGIRVFHLGNKWGVIQEG